MIRVIEGNFLDRVTEACAERCFNVRIAARSLTVEFGGNGGRRSCSDGGRFGRLFQR